MPEIHFPVQFVTDSFSISLHAIMETLAFIVGFRYFLFLRKKQGDTIAAQNRTWILLAAIIGALIGSRLIGSLERPYEMFRTKDLWSYIYHNKTVLGGFLGGLWAVELTKRILHEKHSSGDLFAYPMIFALIIGRIGCFSMGIYEETYGIETNFFTGMNLGDGLMRHPVSLYEIVFLALLWIVMKNFERRYQFAEGARFKTFMIAYILFRFFTDFIKPSYHILFGLSTIQLTALAGLIYYAPAIFHSKKLMKTYA